MGIFGLFLGESWEIGLTGGKYRPRSTFCPDRWAENFFEKSILVPLLLRIWIFNNRLIFRAFYGLSSPNHSFHELRADLIFLFPVSISLLVHPKLGLSHLFCRHPEKKSFRGPPRSRDRLFIARGLDLSKPTWTLPPSPAVY